MNISITVMRGEISLVDEMNAQTTTKLTAGMFYVFFAYSKKSYKTYILTFLQLLYLKSYSAEKFNHHV